MRALKGLEEVIDLYILNPFMGPDGWLFNGEHGTLPADPLYGFSTLRQLYLKADPEFAGRVTVPVLWDKQRETIVNNESSEIIRMFAAEFDDLLSDPSRREDAKDGGRAGLYPAHLRADIDALNEWVYRDVNNGVYRSGFAGTQEEHDKAAAEVFAALGRLENEVLARQYAAGRKFLVGDHLTEADVRLFTTLARFDTAYRSVFLEDDRSIRRDFPRLHLWLRRLYWGIPAFHDTTAPWLPLYAKGYSQARKRFVGHVRPAVSPPDPPVLIEPLKEGESL